jgi:tight adherence protein B
MDPAYLVMGASFVGVLSLVLGVAAAFKKNGESELEARLSAFTGRPASERLELNNTILRDGLTTAQSYLGRLLERFENLPMFFRQAELPIRLEQFLMFCIAGLFLLPAIGVLAGLSRALLPILSAFGFGLPWMWLLYRRLRRMKEFEKQLPDAMELLARALRSGHSLASGLNVVASEMPPPISIEFKSVFEEQNLGLPIEQALRNMLTRVPNVDLQFFVTAVSIQRQAGGDLAEILAKISELIRERFKILGQVKALTGEGRLSGVVLMALPIVLFFTVFVLNRNYVMLLFNDPRGQQMLVAAIIAQILGGYVIHRIVSIRV